MSFSDEHQNPVFELRKLAELRSPNFDLSKSLVLLNTKHPLYNDGNLVESFG